MNITARLYEVMKRENPTLAGARQSLKLSKAFLAQLPGHVTALDPIYEDGTEVPYAQVVMMLDLIVAEHEAAAGADGVGMPSTERG